MNTNTGEIIRLGTDEELPPGFVHVSPQVARAQIAGQRVLASKALRQKRKRERQARKAGRR